MRTNSKKTRNRKHSSSVLTMLGADISSLQRAQDLGQKYYDVEGNEQEPLNILKDLGVNTIRLRVWVNPISGYNNKEKVLSYGAKAKAHNLKLLVDFHYSDTWADPGKQFIPESWSDHTIDRLEADVYEHTYDICNSLKTRGAMPDYVQIGNEINEGMLWDIGKIIQNNFTNLSLLLKQGYKAVKDCNSATQVIIHTANTQSNESARWFYDGIKSNGVDWDITGLSYYCYWHGTMENMINTVKDMRLRYGKPVAILETAYPFTTENSDEEANIISAAVPFFDYPASMEGQARNFSDVQMAAKKGGAIGVFYWEPTWVATKGNGWDPANIDDTGSQWDNQAVFDRTGKVNPYIKWTA